MGMAVVVRDAIDADVEAMTGIYNAFLDSTTIEWTDKPHRIDERILWQRGQQAEGLPVLVAEVDGAVVGWTSYGDFRDSKRWPGYRFTAEHSIHIHRDYWGQGVGRALIDELCARAAAAGIHVMVAGIDAENIASVEFHERLGFVTTGRLCEIGWKHDRWLDLILMQKTL